LSTTLATYPEYVVDEKAADLMEQMGSKPKFWYSPKGELDGRWLFKAARPETGDDWSEKIAAELATLMGLPCAQVELGTYLQARGSISRKFHTEETSLAHGNEMLSTMIPNYPRPNETSHKQLKVRLHTVEAVFQALEQFQVGLPEGWGGVSGIASAADMFTGYLLFDAWIGNTDRHHENWACVRQTGGVRALAPSYDHAASMGALLRGEERANRLTTKDKNFAVEAYASKALSALHATPENPKPMLTLDAFRRAAQYRSTAARVWLERLADVSEDAIETVLSRMPERRMSSSDTLFTRRLLAFNRSKLMNLREDLT